VTVSESKRTHAGHDFQWLKFRHALCLFMTVFQLVPGSAVTRASRAEMTLQRVETGLKDDANNEQLAINTMIA
jgi:hypothetical protein